MPSPLPVDTNSNPGVLDNAPSDWKSVVPNVSIVYVRPASISVAVSVPPG